jgi:type I restriction enzyme M protein
VTNLGYPSHFFTWKRGSILLANNFADRIENEFAWKVNFKTKREQAEASATPHWTKAQELSNEASAMENVIRDLRDSIKGVSDADQRQWVEAEIEGLRAQAESLGLKARDAQAAGDRLYWPIFNLDLKNPNTPEEESHDPDVLLDKYKTLLGQIEETENLLKSELAAALAHHFVGEGA